MKSMNAIKKLIALFLAMTLCLAAFTGCAGGGPSGPETKAPATEATEEPTEPETEEEFDIFAVDHPMKDYPVYTFDHEPTPDEMRAMAVKAMRDMLSVQWYTPTTFTYEKTGAVADKLYQFKQYDRYAGLPYTNANVSLYGFLEYINTNTGRLFTDKFNLTQFANLGQAVNGTIGNTCTGSTNWAVFAVCTSIKGHMVSYTQTVQNGFYPVGDYTYDFSVQEFAMPGSAKQVLTTDICKDTGEQKMYECYALVKPADILCMQGADRNTGHTMMAIEDGQVVRNEDGSINGDESYIRIQDQRAGFYKVMDEDAEVIYNYSGRIDYKASFSELFTQGYIPVTTKEFMGEKAYEKAEVKLSEEREVTGPDDFSGLLVQCNYPLTVVKLVATDAKGHRTDLNIHVFTRAEVNSNAARYFNLAGFGAPLRKNPVDPGTYTITVEARTSTGEVFTPVEFSYTFE